MPRWRDRERSFAPSVPERGSKSLAGVPMKPRLFHEIPFLVTWGKAMPVPWRT